jgi:hypothetical protein
MGRAWEIGAGRLPILGISRRTAAFHLEKARAKLDVRIDSASHRALG